jgi:hypothetical protein
MRNLPSKQKVLIEEAIQGWAELPEGEIFYLEEPCNCGSQIRHNNGGNYHEVIEFCKDSGRIFAKHGSTYENDQAEWEECTHGDVISAIASHGDWL